jgi:arsenate reductase
MICIYHNPRCKKSRDAVSYCQNNQIEIETTEYLKHAPSEADLKRIASKLIHPFDEIIRKKEPIFQENFKNKKLSKEEWIKILHQIPILIERPIVETATKAFVARTEESLKWIQQ